MYLLNVAIKDRLVSRMDQNQARIQTFLSRGVQKFRYSLLLKSSYLMLLSHLGEQACKWAYECNWALIRNDRKKFAGVRKHSWCVRTCEDKKHTPKIRKKSIFATYS